MKAQDLYIGYDYAWYSERPKGIETPMGAARVRLIKVTRKKAHPAENVRLSTFCEVRFLEDNKFWIAKDSIQEVRARDIVDEWHDYSVRQDLILEEKRQEELARKNHEMLVDRRVEFVKRSFEEMGLQVTITHQNKITIELVEAERWLESVAQRQDNSLYAR